MAASCITNWPWPTEKGTRMSSNSNCSRTTVRRWPGCGLPSAFCSTSLMIGSPRTQEVARPQRAGPLGGTLPVEIDLEVHLAADGIGIEADQLEHLAGVGGLGAQAARLAGLAAHLGRERLAAFEHAARVERE